MFTNEELYMSKKKIDRAGVIPYYIDPSTSKIFMKFMMPSNSKFGGFFFFYSR